MDGDQPAETSGATAIPTEQRAADLFRRHLASSVQGASNWLEETRAALYGRELIARLPTLAGQGYRAQQRIADIRQPNRRVLHRSTAGDRRRSSHVRVRFTAVDRPINSTAGINMPLLKARGLGRHSDSTVSLPIDSSMESVKAKAVELFPALEFVPFTLHEGKKGNRLVPITTTLKEMKEGKGKNNFLRIWLLPELEIHVQDLVAQRDGTQPAAEVLPDEPAGPVLPDEPAGPVLPDEPAGPVLPEETAGPFLPEETAGPVLPDEPAGPVLPEEPAGPFLPEETAGPVLPGEPTGPVLPEEPAGPVFPEEPAEQVNAEDESFHLALDISGGGEDFVEAGTPTVLMRVQPRNDIMGVARVLSTTPTEDDNAMVEVQTAPGFEPAYLSDSLMLKIKELSDLIIDKSNGDPLLMEVRRGSVLRDALGMIRYSQQDLQQNVCVRFTGEEGVDLGGLRREFWSLLVNDVAHSSLITGKPGSLTLQKNFVELRKQTFLYLGQLTAMSILQDGPGLPIFADCMVRFILDMDNAVSSSDLPEHLEKVVDEMNQTRNEGELRQMYLQISDEAINAGFLIPTPRFTKDHIPLLTAALVNNMVTSCKQELDQFVEGLNTNLVLDLLKNNVPESTALLSGKQLPVTAKAVRDILKFNYRQGNQGLTDEATGQGFLTFLQATKGTTTQVNGIHIKPKDVLMWLSGATSIPAVGLHKLIDVDFGDSVRVNTCALAVTLTKVPDHIEDIVNYYTELIINSQTFQSQ